MGQYLNPRIIGASVIGFALVAGAHVTSNFGEPREVIQPVQALTKEAPPQRVSIAVTDTDEDGIEDWRDSFVDNSAQVITSQNHATYTPPTTVTGKTTISFMGDIIDSRLYASPLSRTDDEIVAKAVNSLDAVAAIKLFEIRDIDIMDEWDDQDVVNYANTLASAIYRNDAPGLDNEMEILYDIVKVGNTERISDLKTLQTAYKGLLAETLLVPVPQELSKTHLDLINTYQAIYEDISAMIASLDDPLLGLVHIKRYEDDTYGLALALENVYLAIEPYSELLKPEDPALFFSTFNSAYQLN
jgi:hypothetical protein